MYQWLSAHPEVFVPVKEIHYFGSDLEHRRPPVSAERYAELFTPATAEHRAVGDVAVWYLLSETAAEEIQRYNPDARIIIMLRRPAEMLYSLHSQLLYSGEEDVEDFAEALRLESARREGKHIPESTHKGLEAPPTECLYYSQVGAFAEQVARYQKCFSQVHIVLHDDIKSDASLAYRRVLEFLGVDPDFEPDFSVINPNTKAKSQALRKVIQSLWFGPLRRVVPGPLRGLGRRGFEQLQAFNTEAVARPPLDPELRSQLQALFADDVDQLSRLINRPLHLWQA